MICMPDGSKDVLGMWIGENESSKFLLTADLKPIYKATTEDAALLELDRFEED